MKVDLEVGRTLGGGTLESLSSESWALLEFRDGSTVCLSGLSMLTIAEGRTKELHLRRGNLSAKVAHQPAGKRMAIHTPTAKLEILGTQLNIDADASSTVLSVNEGRVRVTRLVDGKVVDVPADHRIVASANRLADYNPRPRPRSVHSWRSSLPKDAKYGQASSSKADDAYALQSAPLLLTCRRPKPLLIYLTALSVSSSDSPPVLLEQGSRFRIRGRMGSTSQLYFGVTMNYPKGGFAGKYLTSRQIEAPGKVGKSFEVELALEEFKPEEPNFPTPIGLEIVDCWCLTLHEDMGLEVSSIELISPKP